MKQPELLVLASDDVIDGVPHGLYREISKKLQLGTIQLVSQNNSEEYPLADTPLGDGLDYYIKDKYSDVYYRIMDESLQLNLVRSKNTAIKNALILMGAKDIKIVENTNDKKSTSNEGGMKGGSKGIGGSLDIKYESELNLAIKTSIESTNSNNVARSLEIVNDYVQSHNLLREPAIVANLELFDIDGKREGHECYTIEYETELKSAFALAASFNLPALSTSAQFERKSSQVQTKTVVIDVTF